MIVSTEVVDRGERRDGLGRLHVPVERQQELVDAYRASGLTRRRFARQEGVRYTTFCTWVQRADKAAGASSEATARPKRSGTGLRAAPRINFAEVALPASAARGLEVRLADGTVVRGELLADVVCVVKALRG